MIRQTLKVDPGPPIRSQAKPQDQLALCEFGVKVLNAEEAGADFVVVYNHEAVVMDHFNGRRAAGDQATIPIDFIGYTNGLAVVDWYDVNGPSSALEVDTFSIPGRQYA